MPTFKTRRRRWQRYNATPGAHQRRQRAHGAPGVRPAAGAGGQAGRLIHCPADGEPRGLRDPRSRNSGRLIPKLEYAGLNHHQEHAMAQMEKPRNSLNYGAFLSGGVDGTRTRDPRRDRPMAEINAGAGLRPVRYSKILKIDAAFSRPARVLFQSLALVSAGLLAACGGGGDAGTAHPSEASEGGCKATASASLPIPGSLASVRLDNPDATPRRFTLSGTATYTAQASGAAGGYSTLVLADGQSPVAVGTISAPASGTAAGVLPFSIEVVLAPGAAATWALVHQPLPSPYGWAKMEFSRVELCAQ